MSKKNKFKTSYGLLGIILIGVGSWGFYSLLNRGSGDLLSMLGVENFYLQTLIVIAFVLVFFIIGGASIWKAFETLIKS